MNDESELKTNKKEAGKPTSFLSNKRSPNK
jgi:hypothetical protein